MPQKRINLLVVLRILIGAILLIAGLEKTLSPYQNFLYIIQAYQLFPYPVQQIAAIVLPWIELITGLFLILGLYTKTSLKSAFFLFALFIAVVLQALARQLPLGECGCFGKLLSIPPYMTVIMDSVIFIFLSLLNRHIEETKVLSLDRMFEKKA